jgi:hypothetical protein
VDAVFPFCSEVYCMSVTPKALDDEYVLELMFSATDVFGLPSKTSTAL